MHPTDKGSSLDIRFFSCWNLVKIILTRLHKLGIFLQKVEKNLCLSAILYSGFLVKFKIVVFY